MSIYRFDSLFAPKSVAIIGASDTPLSAGQVIVSNLLRAGFPGKLWLVNPKYAEVAGRPCLSQVADLPEAPDLAVVVTSADSTPEAVRDLAARGTKTCIVVPGGREGGAAGQAHLTEAIIQAARPHGMRLIGPESFGISVPRAKLDVSMGAAPALAGDLALISQSATLQSTIVDWANARGIGFSAVVSIGRKADIDFGDLLDWFAQDYKTRAILLYVEDIRRPRKFLSAARTAARSKPVVVIKSGLHQEAVRRTSHAGALASTDSVYDAAFRRAGLLRVHDLSEMFDAVETLSRLKPFPGRRLAVVSNGLGPAHLAVDRLVTRGGETATFSPHTMETLDGVLKPYWSRGNPVDIVGGGDPARYGTVVETLLADPGVDAVLAMHGPLALSDPRAAAEAVIGAVEAHRKKSPRAKPVLAAWLTEDAALQDLFETAKIPHHRTPHDAVDGYIHLVRYSQAQESMMEMPPSLPESFEPQVAAARAAVAAALDAGRQWLDPVQTKAVLDAYAIPNARAAVARTAEEAREAAKGLFAASRSCVIKILSDDIPHKSDVGGVRLDLRTPEAVEDAAYGMLARVARTCPTARIEGVVVQEMIDRPRALELIAGITDDPVFGPVVVFGRGGTAVELIADKAVALPPLDMKLARELMADTRVDRRLHGWRDQPPADRDAVALVLVKLAQLAADVPEIREIDLNPLLADDSGVIVVDAKISVAPSPAVRGLPGNPRFAIRPYPKEWERHETLRDGTRVLVRPVRPEDEALYPPFFTHVTAEDLRLRFFAPVKDFSHSFIAKLTQLDYSRAIAFAAIDEATGDLLGVVRLHADPNHETGEYAILLQSGLKGRGLGWLLMRRIIDYGESEGLKSIKGQVLRENTTMLDMCKKLGFEVHDDPEDHSLKVVTFALDGRLAGAVN